MKFALLKYATSNLGDDIQSLAARRFLPRVDTFLDRDQLDQYHDRPPTALICNGWWTHRAATWPPPASIRPLLVSVHVTRCRPGAIERFTDPALKSFYAKQGPVGCRDRQTLAVFRRAGVDAYFSGCLTLTFPRYEGPRYDRITFVEPLGPGAAIDFDAPWWTKLPASVKRRATFLSHVTKKDISPQERLCNAETLLDFYRRSRLVVTGRLHAALPCLAVGTPVVFIRHQCSPERFDGLAELMPVQPIAEVRRGEWRIDWEQPTPVDTARIEPFRERLTETCVRFLNQCQEQAA